MHSRARAVWLGAVVLACCVGSMTSLVLPETASAAPTEAEIADAVETIRADPNLSPQRTMRSLKWVGEDEPEERQRPGWLQWLGGLFQWLAGVSRLILLIGIVVLLGLLGLFIKRVFGGGRSSNYQRAPNAPSHVQELDIRPESLPDEIGAAALTLWDRDEHRAALALLYRGLLSRLVHVHGAPIRESTTEADCLRLAASHLHSDVADYTKTLVRIWQLAVYGAREPATQEARALCAGFDKNFPRMLQQFGGQS